MSGSGVDRCSEVECSWVKCSEGLSNRVFNIIRRYIYIYLYIYIYHADGCLSGCFFYHILSYSFGYVFYNFICFVCFCLIV
jgi:hypothetical protein